VCIGCKCNGFDEATIVFSFIDHMIIIHYLQKVWYT
jgi:hypothetical protein